MTFEDFQKICENDLDTVILADIARELDVTPQVINNWKTKNQVPHKYVKIVKNFPFKKSECEIKNRNVVDVKNICWINVL